MCLYPMKIALKTSQIALKPFKFQVAIEIGEKFEAISPKSFQKSSQSSRLF